MDPLLKTEGTEPGVEPRALDVSFDYVAWLQEVWLDTPPLARPIVLDTMHGAWSCRARRYLQAIFPRTLFSAIHDTPSAAHGGHRSDRSPPDHLEDLAEAVYHRRACLGIALGGDGDRVAFVDGEGNTLSAEEATWVLLQSLGPGLPGERFVYDLKFSDRIPEAARRLGAEPVVERSGHASVRGRMQQTEARFGAETTGHYYFRDLAGGDDGLFAACWLISYLARSPGKSLAELRRDCPSVFMTPDLRVPLETAKHPAVIERVRRKWRKYPQSEIEGVRVDFPDGWALVRGSAAEPALTFRFESSGWEGLGKLVRRFCGGLAEVGESLEAMYHQAAGCGSI
jgi:phosphomannomutase / phosphoglucomutase